MEDTEVALKDESGSEAAEKLLNQNQVNDIVKREKARAAESTRRELEAKHREELEKLQSGSPKSSSTESINIDEIENRVMDKFLSDLESKHKAIEEENAKRELKSLADQYHLKMGKGSELFEDFNDIVADFDPSEFPNTVMLAAQMENTPEIIYELAKHPEKLSQIDALAQRSTKLATKQLARLSDSIKENIAAKANNVSAPAPLSRLKSSTVGTDNGKMTLQDMKSQPWLRG